MWRKVHGELIAEDSRLTLKTFDGESWELGAGVLILKGIEHERWV